MRKLSVLVALVAAFVVTTVDRAHSGSTSVFQVKGQVYLQGFIGETPPISLEGITVMATFWGSPIIPTTSGIDPAINGSVSATDDTDEFGNYIINLNLDGVFDFAIGPDGDINSLMLEFSSLPAGLIPAVGASTLVDIIFNQMNMFSVPPIDDLVVAAPAPASAALAVMGLLGLAWLRRRRH